MLSKTFWTFVDRTDMRVFVIAQGCVEMPRTAQHSNRNSEKGIHPVHLYVPTEREFEYEFIGIFFSYWAMVFSELVNGERTGAVIHRQRKLLGRAGRGPSTFWPLWAARISGPPTFGPHFKPYILQ